LIAHAVLEARPIFRIELRPLDELVETANLVRIEGIDRGGGGRRAGGIGRDLALVDETGVQEDELIRGEECVCALMLARASRGAESERGQGEQDEDEETLANPHGYLPAGGGGPVPRSAISGAPTHRGTIAALPRAVKGTGPAPTTGGGRGARSLPAALLLLVLPLLLFARPAAAQSDTTPAEIVKVRIVGNDSLSTKAIRKVMQVREASLFHSAAFDRDLLEDDLLAIRGLYRSHGYLQAEVSGHRETLNARTIPHQVAVVVEIHEGLPTRVGTIRFAGNTVFSDAELAATVAMKQGGPYDPVEREKAHFRVTAKYLDEGYLKATVAVEVDSSQALRRDLLFRVKEGNRFRAGRIRIEGNAITRDNIIRRELTIKSGEYLRRKEILTSQQNIYDTGLFTRVDLIPSTVAEDGERLDLTVRVRERDMRWLGAGVGYGTFDGMRLTGEWGHRNLAGTARRLDLRLTYGTALFPLETRRVEAGLELAQPRIIGARSLGVLTPFFQRRLENYLRVGLPDEDYRVQSVGTSASIRRDLGRRSRFWVEFTHTWLTLRSASFDTSDPDTLLALGFDRDGKAREASMTISFERDTRDRYLNPTRGVRTVLTGAITAGRPWGFNRTYGKITAFNVWHRPTAPGKVLSFRLNCGVVKSFAPDFPVPDRELFKIGGETTLRGYGDRELGPGTLQVTSTIDWLFPLHDRVQGVVFMDAGGVWEGRSGIKLSQFTSFDVHGPFRYSAGAGIRVQTPVGPLRFGYGQQLGPPVTWETGRPYVVLGQAF
jgi:outer membrane protein insertion porin family